MPCGWSRDGAMRVLRKVRGDTMKLGVRGWKGGPPELLWGFGEEKR